MVGFLLRDVYCRSGLTCIRFWSSQHQESLSQRYRIQVRILPSVPGPTPTVIPAQVHHQANYPPALSCRYHIYSNSWQGPYGGGPERTSNRAG